MSWASDFSYGFFKKILQIVNSQYDVHLFWEAPQVIGEIGKPKLLLRHDVDVSLKRALLMAGIEKNFGIRATYFVMTESLLYHLEDDASRDMLQNILDMGHEIGLHIDPRIFELASIEEKITSACKKLGRILNVKISSFSFHRPLKKDLRGALMIDDRVNAYAEELGGIERYRSDSRGHWKDGNPLPWLMKTGIPLRQLLIHPIWWGGEHMPREKRLQTFVLEETRGKPRDNAEILRQNIIKTIDIEFDL